MRLRNEVDNSLSVLSVGLDFLELGPVHQQLW